MNRYLVFISALFVSQIVQSAWAADPPAASASKASAKDTVKATPAMDKDAQTTSPDMHTPGALIKAVEQRNAEVSRREENLLIREKHVKEMEKEVSAMIERYTILREEVERKQLQLDAVTEEKYVSLSKTYAAMPPEEAAARLEAMEESLALNILSRSKPKIAAKFLGGMTPAKAAKLSLKLVKPPR